MVICLISGEVMGIAERREREKKQRWNDILDAAESVFFDKGYNIAKMDDVAEKAELSKGTLYLYFKSKEELYFGLTLRALNDLRARFQNVIEKDGTGLEKIKNIGDAYYNYSVEEPDFFKTIAQFEMAQLESDSGGEAISQKCHEEGQGVLKIVAQALQEGIDDGTIRNDIHPLKMAFLLQGMSTGFIQLISREENHIKKLELFSIDELRQEFVQSMVRMLKA